MAVICITGSVSPRLQAVENILLQAGMPAPHPLPKEEPIDIRQWQQHVVSSIDGESSAAIKDPGRLWEMLAGEIVLANLNSPLWGWSDPASLRFLDFWLGFAPEFKFLLVCQTPQQLLAERLVNTDTPLNAEELLELWQSQQQEMLRFHHRNPERSLLINASDAVAHPDLLVAECNQRWNLSLATAGIVTSSALAPPDTLANFFAYRVSSLQPEIDALNREIMATATIFAPTLVEDLTAEPQLEEILANYLTLRRRLVEEEVKSQSESERLQRELSVVREALTAQQRNGEARQVVLQSENAQLLLQLQQVQEELETVSRMLSERQTQLDQTVKTKDEQTKLANDRQMQVDQLTKDRDQQKKLAGELQKQAEGLVRECEGKAREIKEQQQENELLLLQLHQVQEELETVHLKEVDLKQRVEVLEGEQGAFGVERAALSAKSDGLQQEISALKLARDEQGKLATDRQAAIDKLTKEQDEATKQLSEQKAQIGQLTKARDEQGKLAADRQAAIVKLTKEQDESTKQLSEQKTQIGQLTKARDQQGKLAADRQAAIDKLTKEQDESTKQLSEQKTQIGHLTKDRDQQKKLAEELQKQRDVSVRECEEQVSRLQSEMKKEQQENELLLLQLHQVQEELERYFLQYQQIQQQYSVTNSTFHRLLERDPKFYDYEDLEVAAENRGDAIPSVNCRLANLTAAGRHFPTLAFSVAIEQGCAGLIFPDSTVATFLRPPLLTAGESELVISPQRLTHLASLSTTDWSLVTTLIRLLTEALAQPQRRQWNSPLSSQTFLSGMQDLARQIAPHHARLRYDAIRLKREQVNPDYEHLWFEFNNLSYAGEIWSHFEFRLSCAHVRPDYFGGFPKLEFPAEGSQAPFEGWFIEASDDFGDKLELRFSLADKALDLGVWERVTAHDRAFIQALVAELPQFLTALRQSGVQIARSWEDWNGMVAEMQSVMVQCDTAVTAIPVAPAAEQNVSGAAGLHYDKVRLKREQVNPDYEHLWLEFANLAFSGESWPHFEFRLSCAHVRPDYFGGFPKLEFPAEGSQAPFEGWFIEASDDFGDKLELRFSLLDKALDLAVWERVPEHDRAFLKALVAELPQLFSTLRQSGVKIRRPWEDWTKMAEEMLPIVTNPPQLKGKKKSSFKKLLRRLKI